MNGNFAGCDQLVWTAASVKGEIPMGSPVINALIVAAILFGVGYGWISYLQNRGQRQRAAAGRDGGGDSYSGSSGGSWFSSDSSGSSSDSGSCSGSGSSGGDCGGGGDGGGGGGGN
jgi:hypothetical protein